METTRPRHADDSGATIRAAETPPSRSEARTVGRGSENAPRAQPPIRWPHPDAASWAIAATWAIGLVLALFVPAFIVGPGETDAEASRVWTAFSMTVIGAIVMILASVAMWRKSKDSALLVLGGVPAIATVAGGVILTAVKLAA